MRRIPWYAWLLVLVFVFVTVAYRVSLVIVRVPSVTAVDLPLARKRISDAHLVLGIVALANAAPGGLDAERVTRQQPAPGRWVVRGSRVDLITEPPSKPATVPNVLGLFSRDAHRILSESGFRYDGPYGEPRETEPGVIDVGGILIAFWQTPSAGTTAAYGTTVTVHAAFPHQPEGTSEGVKAVHGIFYLQYGVQGANQCTGCHTPDTCSGPKCHTGSAAFEGLAGLRSVASSRTR